MFGKKKKKKPEIDPSTLPILPNDLAEHVQTLGGMNSEELVKLFESLGRIDESIIVTRRRPVPGKNTSKEVGGKQAKMSIDEAVEYEKERGEGRTEKENKVREMFGIEQELFERDEINDEIYPKRLAPTDIARSIEAAKDRLEEQARLKEMRSKMFSPREELILDILTLVKKYEAARVAKKIADRQRKSIRGKTLEQLEAEREARIRQLKGEPEPIVETPEEREERLQREEEQKQEAIRTLEGFDRNIRTLVDEAGEVAGENIDAAASVVRQWIGNIVTSDS